jgi:hypothetical protein
MNKEQALSLLAGLGDTPEKVAASLQACAVVGYCNDALHCPISYFLRRHGAHYPATSESVIDFGTDMGTEIVMTTPLTISQFVSMFDAGLFSELIKK